ncbi:MAG: hypothetical protein RSE24_03785 [Oscillospiraceae bacterium]
MAYADYQYYKISFLGVGIAESEFSRLAQRATGFIDNITLGKAAKFADNDGSLKKTCCAVADEMKNIENCGVISSETVGKHTVTYANGSDGQNAGSAKLLAIATQYLTNTGLLYRGCVK